MAKYNNIIEWKEEVECRAVEEISEEGEVKPKFFAKIFANLIPGTKLTTKCEFGSYRNRKLHENCKECIRVNKDLIKDEYYEDEYGRKVKSTKPENWSGSENKK